MLQRFLRDSFLLPAVYLGIILFTCTNCESIPLNTLIQAESPAEIGSTLEQIVSTIPEKKTILFEAMKNNDTFPLFPLSDVIKTSIFTEHQGITYFVFSKKSDKPDTHNFYLGAQQEKLVWDYGVIAYGNNDNLEQMAFKTIHLGNQKEAFKIEGFCGAMCPVVVYFDLSEKAPAVLLRVEQSAFESDIDHDGISEIIGCWGMPSTCNIYRVNNSKVTSTDINKLLGALNVKYRPESSSFVANFSNLEKQFEYIIENGELKINK
ncbi:hypothetical protein LOZ80_25120 [Paenibacillus sp. HWE-109]|uniref:hypothetical protein n=1 Tax=Paenibacillus sp. HWE-109 TaxID=1306526 RepID=UPI001EDEE68C|nr:hypothetical protein [Paenibacillus sp. HWE-109]UKS24873.1 hypothetical protein LOZ80_25120 [Paenibacillus sp. HWE-109]